MLTCMTVRSIPYGWRGESIGPAFRSPPKIARSASERAIRLTWSENRIEKKETSD